MELSRTAHKLAHGETQLTALLSVSNAVSSVVSKLMISSRKFSPDTQEGSMVYCQRHSQSRNHSCGIKCY